MNQRKIEWTIVVFTLALIAAVITVGNITYNNLKKIEHQTEKLYQPNNTILNLKSIISELRNSESNVHSYNLYKNEEYLLSYHHSLELIDNYFSNLYEYQQNDKPTLLLIDSIHSLTEKKIDLLNEHLNIRDDEMVVGELNRISNKLDSIKFIDTVSIAKTADAAPVKKEGFFKRLFKGRKSKDTVDYQKIYTDSISLLAKQSVKAVKTEVSQVKATQTRQLEEMKTKELDLIERDNEINQLLLSTVDGLEKNQNERLRNIAIENKTQTAKTNSFVSAFGSLILVLMLSLIAFSIFYLYRNKKYREKLKHAAQVAEELAKSKEYFLATMSHEIRTPLNSIVGFSEQLLGSSLNEEQRKQSSIIHSSSNHLLEIVNDVLDFSKIEAEKVVLEKTAFNPLEQIQKAVDFITPRAQEKNLQLGITKEGIIPETLIGDPLRLRQIILNLLSNAVKFTAEGKITIHVSSEIINKKQFLKIAVIDTGIGIAPDRLDAVFESFTQADSSITRKYGGTGLGLSITKKLIDLQKGSIKVISELNKGTTLFFQIPYETGSKTGTEEPTNNNNNNKLSGTHLLIADDEAFNRVLIATIAKKHNMTFDEAENGAQVLEMIEKKKYDILLMDVRMPEVSGLDAAMNIRKNSNNKISGVPIIALTATNSPEKRDKCRNAGINEMITKPFKESELIEAIEKLVN